jgi:hypothetical protein
MCLTTEKSWTSLLYDIFIFWKWLFPEHSVLNFSIISCLWCITVTLTNTERLLRWTELFALPCSEQSGAHVLGCDATSWKLKGFKFHRTCMGWQITEGQECFFGRYVELNICDILYNTLAGLACSLLEETKNVSIAPFWKIDKSRGWNVSIAPFWKTDKQSRGWNVYIAPFWKTDKHSHGWNVSIAPFRKTDKVSWLEFELCSIYRTRIVLLS